MKLSTFNDELLAKVDWGRYESVTYEGSGGKAIQMWVVYPPGFDAAKKWPLLQIVHGGTPHSRAAVRLPTHSGTGEAAQDRKASSSCSRSLLGWMPPATLPKI